MQEYPGKFIVLEGSDGSGKTTQFKLLAERLRAVGYDVEVFDFPRYDQQSSYFVKRYLNGDYGPASQINAYAASMFYALDRHEAAPEIRRALSQGKIVVSNRYAGSNMAHQGSKFEDETEQRGFFVWADSLEFSLLSIPRPDINLFLRVPAETAFKLIGEKSKRNYTDKPRDQHEADLDHLKKTVFTYDLLCQLFPKDFVAIDCTQKNQLMSVTAINDRIWGAVQPLLPKSPPHKGRKVVVRLNAPTPPPAEAQTKSEPVKGKGLEVKLNSVSMLCVSSIMLNPGVDVKFGRPWGADLAKYDYLAPPELDKALKEEYEAGIEAVAKLHRQLGSSLKEYIKRLKKAPAPDTLAYAAQLTVPAAALVAVIVAGDELAIINLATRLNASPLAEFKTVAKALGKSIKSGALVLGRPENHDLAALLRDTDLPANVSAMGEPLELLEYWPRNEFSLLTEGIYPYVDLGRDELSEGIERWTYERKEKALRALLSEPTGQVLGQARYRWDAITNRLTVFKALEYGLIDGPRSQSATPRYGYDVPELIEEAGLESEYMECFDISLKLFSRLQAANKETVAAYVTLLGHKLRWRFSTSAQGLSTQISSPDVETGYIWLLGAIAERLAEVHPTLAAWLAKPHAEEAPPSPAAAAKRSRRRSRRHYRRGL